MKKYIFILICVFLGFHSVFSQKTAILKGKVVGLQGEILEYIYVSVDYKGLRTASDTEGKFSFNVPVQKNYTLTFVNYASDTLKKEIFLVKDTTVAFKIDEGALSLDGITLYKENFIKENKKLKPVEAGWVYEGKKTEVIDVENMVGNKSSNNARQAFSKIPSLNIWESDNAGLQLDIGGRGLSPRRTSNFNTRQNGYDISADALGYPESYYTPPLQAVDRIEVVRGAGALQYGSQFGGLVNFKMKEGDTSKAVNFESENTYGAYQFFNTFNSLHGQKGKLNYYTYLQYKRGDGWRENTAFKQFGGFTSLKYKASEKLLVGLDFTHMYYLSQQAGGLLDETFEQDPRSSNRDRNWFRVNWDLANLAIEYQLNERIKIYNKTFALFARRTSLGLLETPDVEDPLSNRDLIDGKFRNVGNETRMVYSYKTKKDLENNLLLGTRIYRGYTNFSQSFGTEGSDADFVKVDTAFLGRRKSDFNFPNFNLSLFAEKIIRLSKTLSLIPGFRYEYIKTNSQGYFSSSIRTNSFGDFVEQETKDTTENNRHIFLYGLGMSKKIKDKFELYANATSNYRAISFTDVRIQTNTQLVDTTIRDESGYSLDIGIKTSKDSIFFLETGLFYIAYNNRIGEVIDDGLRVRTNIGSARIYGAELLFEVELLKALKIETMHSLTMFINGSINRGVYTKINQRALAGVRTGNRLEDLPNYNIKTGLTYRYGKFSLSYLTTLVGDQFSDAANTEQGFKGTFGEIPSYAVADLSLKYKLSDHIVFSSSVNNLYDHSYFTRRATAYPGPGIIPALGRTWNFNLAIKL